MTGVSKRHRSRPLVLLVGLAALTGLAVWQGDAVAPSAKADVILELGRVAGFFPISGSVARDVVPVRVEINGVPMEYQLFSVPKSAGTAVEAILRDWTRIAGDRLLLPFRDRQQDWQIGGVVQSGEAGALGFVGADGSLDGTIRVAIGFDEEGGDHSRVLTFRTLPGFSLGNLQSQSVADLPAADGLPAAAGLQLRYVIAHADSGIPARTAVYEGEGRNASVRLETVLRAAGWVEQEMDPAAGLRLLTRGSAECLLGRLGGDSESYIVLVMRDAGARSIG